FHRKLIVGKRIVRITIDACQIILDDGRNKGCFFHGHPKSKRKDWIDESMGVAQANESFSTEAANLVRVVRNDMNVFHQIQLRKPRAELGMQFPYLTEKEILFRFFLFKKIGSRN